MKKSLFLVLIVACSSSNDQKLHTQSVETHDLAIKIGEHVSEKIEQISDHSSQLEEPLKSLLQDSVEQLSIDYEFWESTIIEVPGHEHIHSDHDHTGHNHSHTPSSDLTPAMVLDIQSDLRNRILKLNIRAQKILNTLNIENESI